MVYSKQSQKLEAKRAKMPTAILTHVQSFLNSLRRTFSCLELPSSKRTANMAEVSTATPSVGGFSNVASTPDAVTEHDIPKTQNLLLLHGKGEQYKVHEDGELPELAFGDLLVEIHAIGLNPIDWKSA